MHARFLRLLYEMFWTEPERHTWVLAVTSFRSAKTKKKRGGGSPSRAKLPILIVNAMKITMDINKPLTIMASGSLAH